MYIPENAPELIAEFVAKAEKALSSRPSDDDDPGNMRILNEFLADSHRFLAGWCGLPPDAFVYNIEKGDSSQLGLDMDWSYLSRQMRKNVETKRLIFSYGRIDEPGRQAHLSIPDELKHVLYHIYAIDEHKRSAYLAYEELESCIFWLKRLLSSARSRFGGGDHLVEVNPNYSRIWCDGEEHCLGPVLKVAIKLIDESGLSGLDPSVLKERFPEKDKPYDIFRSSKAGKILWNYVERVGSRKGRIRLRRAIPKRSGVSHRGKA